MRQLTIFDVISSATESRKSESPSQVSRGIVFHEEDKEVEKASTQEDATGIWKGEMLSFSRCSNWVYLMEARDSGRVKIGISVNPDKRRKQLETSSPHRIALVCAVYGTVNLERRLHKRFKSAHITGEWFRDIPEIRQCFNELVSEMLSKKR